MHVMMGLRQDRGIFVFGERFAMTEEFVKFGRVNLYEAFF